MAGLTKVKGSGLATGAATDSLVGIDDNATSTAITIDASENVLIGGTNTLPGVGNTATGHAIYPDGRSFQSKSGNTVASFNRNTNDGGLLEFRKEGTTVGSIDVSASGASIKLGGTAAANALDDYEEGTWTPVIKVGSTINTGTDSSTSVYTKIGRQVTVYLSIHTITKAGTGYLTIEGLPFTVGTTYGLPGALRYGGINTGGRMVALALNNKIEFQNYNSTQGYTGSTYSTALSGTYSLYSVSITYFV